MSFPYSYATLGLVPGLILTVVVAGLVLYTSLVLWYVTFEPRLHKPFLKFQTGNSVCATLKSRMSVTLVKCSFGAKDGRGGLLPSCSS